MVVRKTIHNAHGKSCTQVHVEPFNKSTCVTAHFGNIMDVHTGGMCVHISMTHMHEAPDSRMHRQHQLSFSATELCRA